MAERSPARAIQQFAEDTQRALSCLTRQNKLVLDRASGVAQSLTLAVGDSVRLQGLDRLSLRFRQRIIVVGSGRGARERWDVRLHSYLYAIDDAAGREILSYHWNPAGTPSFPHLHLNAGARVGLDAVRKAHIPTGWSTVHDIVLLAVRELGAAPVRADWQAIVAGGTDAFRGEAPPV